MCKILSILELAAVIALVTESLLWKEVKCGVLLLAYARILLPRTASASESKAV